MTFQAQDVSHRRAKAHPTKAFFVRMLTRDISLLDCILDLIDNAVDAAWAAVPETPTKLESGTSLAAFEIRLDIRNDEFSIADNCGGISLDNAVDYAFTFGRDEANEIEDYSIGVYGIGLKRAVFKLGNRIAIRSTALSDEPFVVPINVEDWVAETSGAWDFDIEPSPALPNPGVELRVSELHNETVAEFSDPTFAKRLHRIVARDYLLPFMQGLQVIINDTSVQGWAIHFKSGPDFQPMRNLYHEGDVAVEIFAGAIAAPPDTNEPEQSAQGQRSGWYVLCNGRVVLAADKTALTVWENARFPKWHPQYEGFVGVVLFSSRHSELLPMTTTKNGVDVSSALYRRAVAKMQQPTRAWIDYTNARKASLETAHQREEAAPPVPIESVQDRKTVQLPKAIDGPKQANVLYLMPLERVEALARAFGQSTMPYREVGRRSFEYSYEQLVDESDQ